MANRVIELQKMFQASTKPLWWRHPRSAFYMYPFWGLFAVAVIAPLLYIPNTVKGIKPKKN
ncbi:LAFE_0E05424g1_1 [Lachancea fermentati]|uniref:LAFE_0E05424g1_1 n=1 Tax=Lachancea fermentati TaxID=4955 RepID=A0A1G4MCR9_LACFM|nr:LAFE_0E05424g1_1 [Lachancea fermentati]